MKTNEAIYKEINESGFITKQNLELLKNRSNRAGKDLFDYEFMDAFGDGYGIPVTEEQGSQGLAWLKKFLKKDVYGYREIEIVKDAKPGDFLFRGFYDSGNMYSHSFLPIYNLDGMEYVPLSEPYIIG